MIINRNEKYDQIRFDKAVGMKKDGYLSNFYQLINPIIDEFGNQYWNSEGYYMALRTNDLEIKSKIALMSKNGGMSSRNARNLYKLEQDESNRVEYMRKAVYAKFDNNTDIKEKLLKISGEIMEKNYWNDTLFGVNDKTLKGANILGKLLMEYRDLYLPEKKIKFFE